MLHDGGLSHSDKKTFAMPHLSPQNTVQQVFPYLIVRNAEAAIDFYKRVFDAEETMRLAEPSGRVGHAEIKLGDAMVMLAEEHPEIGMLSPLAANTTSSFLHLHVADVDGMTQRAADAGAKSSLHPKLSSTASARRKSKTRSVMFGCSANISKTSRQTRCSGAIRNCFRARTLEASLP